MAVTSTCRVCGKEYVPCKNAKYDPKVFNWKEVACSPECGGIYLERVIASRQSVPEEKPRRAVSRKKQIVEVEAEPAMVEPVMTIEAAEEVTPEE